jgi:hypothetical protein
MSNNNNTLSTIEDVQKAIADTKNPTMLAILQELLKSKQREAELMEKAKRTKASPFTDDEVIVKSVFVALRPQVIVNSECNAKKAFKAVINELNIKFDAELQRKLFASSIQHCATCNILKSKDIEESMTAYKDAVNQSKKLLPLIDSATWDAWLRNMEDARVRAYNKQGKTLPELLPDHLFPAEPVQVEPVQVEPVQDKKVIITTKKSTRKNK